MIQDAYSKATPRPWKLQVGKSWEGMRQITMARENGAKDWILRFYEWKFGEETADANAELVVQAVNSYNPERDKLARELAEIVSTNAIVGSEESELADRLLALYEE